MCRQWPVLAAVPVYLVMVVLTFGHTPDDGLITLRFAENVLAYGRPDFNVGDPVEGYSSPLHLLVAIVAALAPGAYTTLALKLLGVVFGGAVLWQTVRLGRNVGLTERVQFVCALLVALSWNLAASSVNGLETSLYVLLLTGLVASLTAEPARVWAGSGWAVLLVLTRPDAVVLVTALAGGCLLLRTAQPVPSRIRWALAPVFALVALVVFRYLYFRQLLPNTYHAKDLPLSESIPLGLEYLLQGQPWWGTSAPLAAAALAVQIVCAAAAVRLWWTSRRTALLVALVIAAQGAVILRAGGDWMYGARHLSPVIPALTVAAVAGAVYLVRRIRALIDARHPDYGAARTGAILTAAAAAALIVAFTGPALNTYHPPSTIIGVDNTALIRTGGYEVYSPLWIESVRLTECLPPGTSVAFSEMGLFGLSNRHLDVVDTRGLTNSEIAHTAPPQIKKRTGVEDPNWSDPDSTVGSVLIERKPDVILAISDEDPQPTVLGGRYTLISTYQPADGTPRLAHYRADADTTHSCGDS